MAGIDFPHLFVRTPPDASDFTSHRTGRDNISFPDRPSRRSHADFVKRAFEQAWKNAEAKNEARKAVALPTRTGTYIEFQSALGFDLKTKSFDLRQSGIRLLNVSTKSDQGQSVTYATVYIPKGKEAVILKKINQYQNEKTKNGKPKHEPFVAGIDNLKEAVLQSFWRDSATVPKDVDWCEAWIRYSGTPDSILRSFVNMCEKLEIEYRSGPLVFPERAIILIKASEHQLSEIILSFDNIAEFRKAKVTAGFWMGIDNSDQSEFVSDLRERLTVSNINNVSACLLDTGANNGHTLLAPVLSDEDCYSVDPDWGANDEHGHGTLMCGLAAYGSDLDLMLESTELISIPYQLESVKLIPSPGMHHGKELYGLRTKQAISRAEVENPERKRVVCLSITSEDHRDEGRPSSWSGAVDQICSGAEDDTRRLLVVAAGNVQDPKEWSRYPDSNVTQAVHDPGQAWNALTVGAFTNKTEISDPEFSSLYDPIAAEGQLSPFSSTSHLWDKKWPNKPEVVFEGGNAAIDQSGFTSEIDDLSILSTSHLPQVSQLGLMNATSAASAQATRLAAQLYSLYPRAWPETIRALIVHSADWNEAIKAQFSSPSQTEKQNFGNLLKSCGFGMPNVARAIESAANSLTLITEQEIQPFQVKKSGCEYETKEMHIVELPWPVEVLAELPGETAVTINVTLSYFIEPGPGEIGWRDKYRYRSHGLDFDLKGPTEDRDDFLKKLNKAAIDDDGDYSGGSSINWSIGTNTRNRGSIHRDWWTTSAAEAMACNVIGVFPRTGWWKERYHLKKGEMKTRYSLVVTLETPIESVDIYTPIANIIDVPTQITSN